VTTGLNNDFMFDIESQPLTPTKLKTSSPEDWVPEILRLLDQDHPELKSSQKHLTWEKTDLARGNGVGHISILLTPKELELPKQDTDPETGRTQLRQLNRSGTVIRIPIFVTNNMLQTMLLFYTSTGEPYLLTRENIEKIIASSQPVQPLGFTSSKNQYGNFGIGTTLQEFSQKLNSGAILTANNGLVKVESILPELPLLDKTAGRILTQLNENPRLAKEFENVFPAAVAFLGSAASEDAFYKQASEILLDEKVLMLTKISSSVFELDTDLLVKQGSDPIQFEATSEVINDSLKPRGFDPDTLSTLKIGESVEVINVPTVSPDEVFISGIKDKDSENTKIDQDVKKELESKPTALCFVRTYSGPLVVLNLDSFVPEPVGKMNIFIDPESKRVHIYEQKEGEDFFPFETKETGDMNETLSFLEQCGTQQPLSGTTGCFVWFDLTDDKWVATPPGTITESFSEAEDNVVFSVKFDSFYCGAYQITALDGLKRYLLSDSTDPKKKSLQIPGSAVFVQLDLTKNSLNLEFSRPPNYLPRRVEITIRALPNDEYALKVIQRAEEEVSDTTKDPLGSNIKFEVTCKRERCALILKRYGMSGETVSAILNAIEEKIKDLELKNDGFTEFSYAFDIFVERNVVDEISRAGRITLSKETQDKLASLHQTTNGIAKNLIVEAIEISTSPAIVEAFEKCGGSIVDSKALGENLISVQLIGPENIHVFVQQVPVLKNTKNLLAQMLMSTQLGANLPSQSIISSLTGIESVITTLEDLKELSL